MSTTSQSAPLDSIPYPIEDLLPIQAKPTTTTAPYPTQNFEDSIDNYYESDYDYILKMILHPRCKVSINMGMVFRLELMMFLI